MAESTLILTFDQLKARVGKQHGYTRTSTNWSTEESTRISEFISDGLRRFYGEREWNFLKPYRSFATVASTSAYVLPEDVGYIEGNLFFEPETGYREILMVDAEIVLRYRQQTSSTGTPRVCAVRPKMSDGVTAQRSELILWPTPDAAYTLNYKYRCLPDALSTDQQYALGGAAHSQTILHACLAAAAVDDDEVATQEQKYREALERSVNFDAHAYAPRSLGYNANRRHRSEPQMPPDVTLTFNP